MSTDHCQIEEEAFKIKLHRNGGAGMYEARRAAELTNGAAEEWLREERKPWICFKICKGLFLAGHQPVQREESRGCWSETSNGALLADEREIFYRWGGLFGAPQSGVIYRGRSKPASLPEGEQFQQHASGRGCPFTQECGESRRCRRNWAWDARGAREWVGSRVIKVAWHLENARAAWWERIRVGFLQL